MGRKCGKNMLGLVIVPDASAETNQTINRNYVMAGW